MNAQISLIKCNCQNCNGRIEFDSDQAGAMVSCPHCGMETLLYIPQATSAPNLKAVAKYRRIPRKIILIVLGGIVFAIVLGIAAAKVTSQMLPQIAEGTAAIAYLIIAVILFIMAFLIALLWLLFPVFVYFGIQRLEQLLQQIERNSRHS